MELLAFSIPILVPPDVCKKDGCNMEKIYQKARIILEIRFIIVVVVVNILTGGVEIIVRRKGKRGRGQGYSVNIST